MGKNSCEFAFYLAFDVRIFHGQRNLFILTNEGKRNKIPLRIIEIGPEQIVTLITPTTYVLDGESGVF